MISAQQGNEAIVKILLKYGADPNLADKFGKSSFDKTSSPMISKILNSTLANNSKERF